MFVYKSRFLRRGEVWFDNEPGTELVDWILYRNRTGPIKNARWRPFFNRLIDLSRSKEEIMGGMEPKTREKIEAAAGKDHVRCEFSDITSGRQLDEIEQMWNESFEAKRRWGVLNRAWLAEMISARAFKLAVAREPSGAFIVAAGLINDKHRVQQLFTVSPPRTASTPEIRFKTNRASCFLLWETMLRLKQAGIKHFDFGGWYPGTDDIQLLGANSFKRGFGGEVVREFECEQIRTLKGWVVLAVSRLISRAKAARSLNLL